MYINLTYDYYLRRIIESYIAFVSSKLTKESKIFLENMHSKKIWKTVSLVLFQKDHSSVSLKPNLNSL